MEPTRVFFVRTVLALGIATALMACSGTRSGNETDAATWPCPSEWVPYARGGCGPAVLLCTSDGGAAPDACTGVDLSQSHAVTTADGGTGTSFWRRSTGEIAGGWPAADFAPDAGFHQCPPGWSSEGDTCSPALSTTCGDNSAAYPGGSCTQTAATDCPVGAYADPGAEATGATLIHVDASASAAGADGTVAHPYPSIALGIAAGGAGAWVLLAAGTYSESIAASNEVHIVGVCAARVIVTPPAGTTGATAAGAAARLDVRGTTLRGGGTGVLASSGATVKLRSVVVQGATGMGVRAGGAGSSIDGADVWVRDTMDLNDGATGWGALTEGGASITLSRAVISGSRQIGVAALGAGSNVTLTDASVTDTAAVTHGGDGGGLHAQDGAAINATRVVLARNTNVNAGALGAGSSISITDGAVLAGVPRADGTFGRGLHAQSGSTITATRVRIENNAEVGASALGTGTVLSLTDSTVRATRPTGAGAAGRGLYAQDGARLEARGVMVDANHDLGAGAFGAGTVEVLTDSTVRGTRAAMDVTQGGGLQAQNGATLSATRVLVDDNQSVGATGLDPGTTVSLADSIVRATAVRTDGTFGRGALSQGGARVQLDRVLLEGNHEFGAVVHGSDTVLALADSAVRNTQPTPTGSNGRGVQVERNGTLVATRVVLEQNAELGIAVYLQGSQATLEDVIVLGTVASGRGLGGGIAASGGASVTAARVSAQDVHAIGLGALVASDPSLGMFYNATLTATDVFVRRVATGTTHFTSPIAGETPQSYGLYAGESSTLSATCAVVDDGEYGFVDNKGTALTLHQALLSQQRHAAGATTGGTAGGSLDLSDIVYEGNASDTTAQGIDLPEVH